MLIRLSLAAIACLTLLAQAVAQPPKAASRELNAILCTTEDQAIAVATSMAAGKTEESVDRDHLSVRFGDLWAAKDGAVASDYDEKKMSAYMKRPELEISVDVGVGRGSATVWTCDLTKRYIEINGDYRS